MSQTSNQDSTLYHPVANDEEQYSIWPVDKPLPAGWRVVGDAGSKATVLAFIEQVWTDMRPLSVRRDMASELGAGASGGPLTGGD